MEVAGSREFLAYWDVTLANPNGDMLNDNMPRMDEQTGKLEVSDVRFKRFERDEFENKGYKILVKTKIDEKGNVMSCTNIVKEIMTDNKINALNLPAYLTTEYMDVKLFGATITKPKYDIVGPLQVTWSRSINVPKVKFAQGNAAYASGEGKGQASIWSKYLVEYALFRTYAAFNSLTAKRQNIPIAEEDLDLFRQCFIDGLVNYRSTSKNQMPRLFVEVIYKENGIDGELDCVDVKYDCKDEELRSITEVTFDFTKLSKYYNERKDKIKKVRIYKHRNVNLENVPEYFELYNF